MELTREQLEAKRILHRDIPMELWDYKVNDKLQLKLHISREGAESEDLTLEHLLQEQAVHDTTNPQDVMNMLINGFKGYKDMRLYEFLEGHIVLFGNVKSITLQEDKPTKERKRL